MSAAVAHAEPVAERVPARALTQPHDRDEREADRAADVVAGGGSVTGWSFCAPPAAGAGPRTDAGAALSTSGRPLEPATRRAMERRFGYDFARVRVHDDARTAGAAARIDAAAFTVGSDIGFAAGRYEPRRPGGRWLLAHELAHVVQAARWPHAAVRRKVVVANTELDARARAAFLTRHRWTSGLHASVMADMADAGDVFDFTNEAELATEIGKRVSTVRRMDETQTRQVAPPHNVAFGYPFSHESALYGPRVNYAARAHWTPRPFDDYARRTDRARNARLMALPRSRRHEVYGDMGGNYSWTLTDVGKRDAYSAVALMFAPQEAHRRSLLHCDYLVSLVHFRSLADSIGQAEFNRRITAFGVDRIRLWALAYFDLHQTVEDTVAGRRVSRPGIDSLQRIAPSSERDLVLGDHVVFFNHLAYDLLNVGIGNAWRLENAVLVRRTSQGDVFEGHGSGTLTAAQMRTRLAQEFNTVVRTVRSWTRAATSRDPRTAAEARARLAQNTYLVQRPDGWHVAGQAMLCTATHVDRPVREIRADEVIGLRNPCDLTRMYVVERPVESARGTP